MLLVIGVIFVTLVLASALACAETVIGTFVELSVDMGVGVLIIVSNVLVGVGVNVIAGAMTAFEFAIPDPLAEFRC